MSLPSVALRCQACGKEGARKVHAGGYEFTFCRGCLAKREMSLITLEDSSHDDIEAAPAGDPTSIDGLRARGWVR